MSITKGNLETFVAAGINAFPHQPFPGEEDWLNTRIEESVEQRAALLAERDKITAERKEAVTARELFDTQVNIRAYDAIGMEMGAKLVALTEEYVEARSSAALARKELQAARERGESLVTYGQRLSEANWRVGELKRDTAAQQKKVNAYVNRGITADGEDLRLPFNKRIQEIDQQIAALNAGIFERDAMIAKLKAWQESIDPSGTSEVDVAFAEFIAAGIKLDGLAVNHPGREKIAERLLQLRSRIPLLSLFVDMVDEEDGCGRGCC